jgi:hypothetical protein
MIYGGFAVEVIWNREGTSFDIKYLPIHTLRIGLKENEDEKIEYHVLVMVDFLCENLLPIYRR